MIDNVFELENLERSGVLDVTVDGVSVVHSGNVAEVPAIDNVTQTNTTADAEHRVLLSNSANSTTETAGVGKSNGLLYNPSAKQLIVRNPNYSTYMTMTEPNIGIYQKSNPNSYWGGVRITARDITLEGKVSDTSSVNQTWDGANTSLKSAISSLRTDMDSTTLSGTSEPTSSVGRENSLYVKYQGETEIVPSTSVPVRTWQSFPVDISSYQKIRIVIDGYDGYNRHHSYDDIIDVSSSPSYLNITDGDMILLQISFSENEYMSSYLTGQFTIYDDSFTIDDIYFKNDDEWIKQNVYHKDDIVVLTTSGTVNANDSEIFTFTPSALENNGIDVSEHDKWFIVTMQQKVGNRPFELVPYNNEIYPLLYLFDETVGLRITVLNNTSAQKNVQLKVMLMRVED